VWAIWDNYDYFTFFMKLQNRLEETLKEIGRKEAGTTGEHWTGHPKRWWDANTWRCVHQHVRVLNPGAISVCSVCDNRLFLTFPEDVSGPLKSD